jgi:Fur family zinc uptake transcriptional regulator
MSKAGCAHDGDSSGLAGGALAAALTEADSRLTAADERLTGPRRRVLELLLQAGGPVKAYDLIAAYGEGGAKPPTVYRALEFLERQGFAHRLESLNAYVACLRAGEVHGAAFLICDCCGAAVEVEPDVAAGVAVAASAHGYEVRRVMLEARGLCAACRRGEGH